MRISGALTMHAPAGRVWAALTDPAVLVATIPGCEQFEPAGPDSYRFTVAAAVASIQASYTGEVSLSQQQEPSSFVLTASGAGAPGSVTTSVRIRLTDIADGTTELSYDADAVIGGLIAGVGQRMLSSVAKRLANAFFNSVDEVLAGTGHAGRILAGTVPAGTVPAGTVLAATGAGSQAAPRAAPEPTVPEPTGPASTGLVPPVPASTGPACTGPACSWPVSTGPVPTVPMSTVPASVGPQAGAYQAPARRGGSPGFPLDAKFARGMVAGAAVTLAGVAVSGRIRRRAR